MNDTLNLRRVPCVNARKSRKRRLLTRFNAAGVTLTLAGAIFLTAGIGCSRQKYRTDADNEVYQLLNTVNSKASPFRKRADPVTRIFTIPTRSLPRSTTARPRGS